jgi:hypothetical protein
MCPPPDAVTTTGYVPASTVLDAFNVNASVVPLATTVGDADEGVQVIPAGAAQVTLTVVL